MSESYVVSLDDVQAAAERIRPYLENDTPVHTSSAMNKLSGGHELFFKCELFQKTGSFKVARDERRCLSYEHTAEEAMQTLPP